MRCNKIVCLTVILMTAGFAAATTVWNPAANDIVPPDVGNWADPNNWNNGLPGFGTEDPPLDPKAVFNVADAAECIVTDEQGVHHLVMGDGGADEQNNVLRIMDGGSITTGAGQWAGIGWNRPATLIVEKGGVFDVPNHLWVGHNAGAEGTIIVNGGTITVDTAFDLGRVGGTGHVQLNDGLLAVEHVTTTGSSGWFNRDDSLMDIRFGTFTVNRDLTTGGWLDDPEKGLIETGKLVAFGGLGTLNVEYADGVTTITAKSPLEPYPAYNATVEDGDVPLAWTNLDPNDPGDSVWVDVWFGTDPNKLSMDYSQVVLTEENTDAVMVNAPVIGTPPTTYYWQVDSYLYGDPAVVDYDDPETPIIEGDVFKFDVTDVLPPLVSITTQPTVTWVDEPVQLNTQQLQGAENVTYLWTSSLDDPNVVFLPSDTDPNPTVTVDYHAAQFTVTVTIDDEFAFNPPHSATLELDCADNPCQAARSIGLGDAYPGDIVVDCKVDLEDFAAIASEWLTDYALTQPIPLNQEE